MSGTGGVRHCCRQMTGRLEHVCSQHPDPFECPDHLVIFAPRFREYGLIVHDGGTGVIPIRFCPWCGSTLPAPLRDRWFDELHQQGIDPLRDTVPPRYLDHSWWSQA